MRIKGFQVNSNKIEITIHIPTVTNNSHEFDHYLPNTIFKEYPGIKCLLLFPIKCYSHE